MRHFYILKSVFVAVCLSTMAGISADEALQSILTNFSPPFNTLNIPVEWNLDDSEKTSIEFVHHEDEKVCFDIQVGALLEGNVSLELLEAEVLSFIHGETNTIPLIESSLGNMFEDETVENARSQIDPNIERITMGKIELLKFSVMGEFTVETTTPLGVDVLSTPTLSINYAILIRNRLVFITFTAPVESFSLYTELFQRTMGAISR